MDRKLPLQPRKRRGVVLLLALILMAAITASTVAISILISSTLRESRHLDDFIVASLAADSGLERGLAIVKVSRGPVKQIGEVLTQSAVSGAALAGGSEVSVASTEDDRPISVPRLRPGQTLTFDLLKTNMPAPHCLLVSGICIEHPATPGTCNSAVDVQWVVIRADGKTEFSGRMPLGELQYEPGIMVDFTDSVRSETNDTGGAFAGGTLGFRARIQTFDLDLGNGRDEGEVSDLTFTPFTGATCDEQSRYTSRIRLNATGEAGDAGERVRSVKSAGVLWLLPASPLLQYVLFSEGSIIP